ncbi:hypothetical protein ES703_22101 [subsurface metagenome]
MAANRGDWTGTGAFGAQYATLTQGQTLVSVMPFRYGVAIFDFYTDDPTDIVVGFRASANDYAYFTADQFQASKHGVAATPEAIALAATTWYHAQLNWCPQFVEIYVWDVDNTLIGYSKKRTPSNRLMNLYFEVLAATGTTLYVGGVTCQEADDPVFFLDPIDHINAQLEPVWDATLIQYDYGVGVQLDAVDERCNYIGTIREGFAQYRVIIFYHSDGVGTVDLWVRDNICDGTANIPVNNIHPAIVAGYGCIMTGWNPLTGLATRIGGIIQNNDEIVIISGVYIEFR